MEWREGEGPYVSVSVAIGLTLLSVALLILHVHGLARSLVSETVIELVGRELDDGVSEFEPLEDGAQDDPEPALPDDFSARASYCGLRRGGYVQAIEFAALVKAARCADVLVVLRFRAGDYVVEGGRDIAVYLAHRFDAELHDAIAQAFTIGPDRTPVQDLEFSIRHLVEIAVRALSTGINDPYTAAAVVNRLSASLARLMRAALPSGALKDEDGALRVICERRTYGSLIGAAFHQIRQNGGDKPLVLIHLLSAIRRIAPHVHTKSQADALRTELQDIAETAKRQIDDSSDLAKIEKHVRAASKALGEIKTADGAGLARAAIDWARIGCWAWAVTDKILGCPRSSARHAQTDEISSASSRPGFRAPHCGKVHERRSSGATVLSQSPIFRIELPHG